MLIMTTKLRQMDDDQLVEISRAVDRLDNPLQHRFEGDDTHIVDFMNECGLGQDIVSKLLVSREVLRECVARGIQIPRANSKDNAPEDYSPRPQM